MGGCLASLAKASEKEPYLTEAVWDEVRSVTGAVLPCVLSLLS